MGQIATIYDLTTKEYISLGKAFSDKSGFQMPPERISAFLTRLMYGHKLIIGKDGDEPENFWEDEEYVKWSEVDCWTGEPEGKHTLIDFTEEEKELIRKEEERLK